MTEPDRRTGLQQALRGTAYVIAIAIGVYVVAAALAFLLNVVLT